MMLFKVDIISALDLVHGRQSRTSLSPIPCHYGQRDQTLRRVGGETPYNQRTRSSQALSKALSDAKFSLQVDPKIDPEDLAKAWRKVARKWHPGMS